MAKVSEGSFRRNANLVDKRSRGSSSKKKQSYCCARACHKPIRKALGVCAPCWAELKIFRRYLREGLLKLEPLFGDVPLNERGPRLPYIDLSHMFAQRRKGSPT